MQPTDLFKQLSDGTRLRIIVLLFQEEELCVCELVHALEAPQPAISRNLGKLRKEGLLQSRRRGVWIHYRLDENLPSWIMALLNNLLEGVEREKIFAM
ncbi:metalloregulator ArsR/SmtB family transcription factor, partial [Magnetococcales bacterium HHB-1]